MHLRDLVEDEGWTYVEDLAPGLRPDALGSRQLGPLNWAQACENDVLAVRPDGGINGIDAVYAASHEIADARRGFTHDEEVWREQTEILTRWCKRAMFENQLPLSRLFWVRFLRFMGRAQRMWIRIQRTRA